jgi:hypothetical protein
VQNFDQKAQRKTSLARSRRRWEGNIKMDLGEIELEIVNFIDLALNRDCCEHSHKPSCSVKGG